MIGYGVAFIAGLVVSAFVSKNLTKASLQAELAKLEAEIASGKIYASNELKAAAQYVVDHVKGLL